MHRRPAGVTALAVFFGLGAVISATAASSLLMPGGMLEPMWRLNPRARAAFSEIGVVAPLLLACVSAGCALAALGLWRRRRWGYWMGLGLLAVNGIGDAANALLGTERRAALGIPVVVALLFYLSRPSVRAAFDSR